MKFAFAIQFVASCALLVCGESAFPHVTLQDEAAATGAAYKAVLRVGHGCDGAATTAIQVAIPEGFNAAQPMIKPGWTISTQVGKLAQPYTMHGVQTTEGVRQITWTANSPESYLPDALYDEFVLRGTTPAKPGVLWFKVLQTCVKGVNDWSEIPAAGHDAHSLKHPAARLEVLDVPAVDHEHHH